MKYVPLVVILFSCSIYAQSLDSKIQFILKANGTIDTYKSIFFDFRISPLKVNADPKTLLKLEKIEEGLTDDNITSRLSKGFRSSYTESEINDIYQFYNSSAGQKILYSADISAENFNDSFLDITQELQFVAQEQNLMEQPILDTKKDMPVSTTRTDGFYTVVNYVGSNLSLRDLQLADQPLILKSDLLEVKVDQDQNGRNILDIILTSEGAAKFKRVTKKNIGKPLAIVLNKKIISAPLIIHVIPNGRLQISGDFSKNFLLEMAKAFKSK